MNWYKKAAEADAPLISLDTVPGAGEGYGMSPDQQQEALKGYPTESDPQETARFMEAYQLMNGLIDLIRDKDIADDRILSDAIAEARAAIVEFESGGAAISPANVLLILKKLLKAMAQSERVDKADYPYYQKVQDIFPAADLKLEEQ